MVENRILVTGGCGFIGSNVCAAFLKMGCEVICLDNLDGFYSQEMKLKNIQPFITNPKFHFELVDITDKSEVRQVLKKHRPETVIHLASKVNVLHSMNKESEYFTTNVLGTQTLMDAMIENQIFHLIFASSSSVYGETSNVDLSESDSLKPISPYGRSKALAEEVIFDYHSRYALKVTILRLFNVYGTNMRPDLFISKIFHSIQASSLLSIFNMGENRKDFTFISDVLSGFEQSYKVGLSRETNFQTFNIGTGTAHAIKEIIQTAEKLLEAKVLAEYVDKIEGDVSYTRANITLAQKELSYHPSISIPEGLFKTFNEMNIHHENRNHFT
jgi:UDP-glucuronate 4-epimerase